MSDKFISLDSLKEYNKQMKETYIEPLDGKIDTIETDLNTYNKTIEELKAKNTTIEKDVKGTFITILPPTQEQCVNNFFIQTHGRGKIRFYHVTIAEDGYILWGDGQITKGTGVEERYYEHTYDPEIFVENKPITFCIVGLTKIGEDCFNTLDATNGYRIKSIIFNESVSYLGPHCIASETLEKLVIKGSPELDYYAISNCAELKELDLGSTHTIGHHGIAKCDQLTTIKFPEECKSLGWGVTSNCTSLNKIILSTAHKFEDLVGILADNTAVQTAKIKVSKEHYADYVEQYRSAEETLPAGFYYEPDSSITDSILQEVTSQRIELLNAISSSSFTITGGRLETNQSIKINPGEFILLLKTSASSIMGSSTKDIIKVKMLKDIEQPTGIDSDYNIYTSSGNSCIVGLADWDLASDFATHKLGIAHRAVCSEIALSSNTDEFIARDMTITCTSGAMVFLLMHQKGKTREIY
jgi:hypothetical protein